MNTASLSLRRTVMIGALAAALTACGGGGGGHNSSTPSTGAVHPPPPSLTAPHGGGASTAAVVGGASVVSTTSASGGTGTGTGTGTGRSAGVTTVASGGGLPPPGGPSDGDLSSATSVQNASVQNARSGSDSNINRSPQHHQNPSQYMGAYVVGTPVWHELNGDKPADNTRPFVVFWVSSSNEINGLAVTGKRAIMDGPLKFSGSLPVGDVDVRLPLADRHDADAGDITLEFPRHGEEQGDVDVLVGDHDTYLARMQRARKLESVTLGKVDSTIRVNGIYLLSASPDQLGSYRFPSLLIRRTPASGELTVAGGGQFKPNGASDRVPCQLKATLTPTAIAGRYDMSLWVGFDKAKSQRPAVRWSGGEAQAFIWKDATNQAIRLLLTASGRAGDFNLDGVVQSAAGSQ